MARGTFICISSTGEVTRHSTRHAASRDTKPDLLDITSGDLSYVWGAERVLFVPHGSPDVWLMKDREPIEDPLLLTPGTQAASPGTAPELADDIAARVVKAAERNVGITEQYLGTPSDQEMEAVYSLCGAKHVGHRLTRAAIIANDERRYLCSCGAKIGFHIEAIRSAMKKKWLINLPFGGTTIRILEPLPLVPAFDQRWPKREPELTWWIVENDLGDSQRLLARSGPEAIEEAKLSKAMVCCYRLGDPRPTPPPPPLIAIGQTREWKTLRKAFTVLYRVAPPFSDRWVLRSVQGIEYTRDEKKILQDSTVIE